MRRLIKPKKDIKLIFFNPSYFINWIYTSQKTLFRDDVNVRLTSADNLEKLLEEISSTQEECYVAYRFRDLYRYPDNHELHSVYFDIIKMIASKFSNAHQLMYVHENFPYWKNFPREDEGIRILHYLESEMFLELGSDKVVKTKRDIFNSMERETGGIIEGFFSEGDVMQIVAEEWGGATKDLFYHSDPKLYMIVSPSGFGKSSLINKAIEFGVKKIDKITTRPNRDKRESNYEKVKSVTEKEFLEMVNDEEVIGQRRYKGHLYGFRAEEIQNLDHSDRSSIIDSTDFRSSYELREKYPDKIKIVTIFPSLDFAGYGLEKRIKKISEPSEGFESFKEELEFIKRSKNVVLDTKERMNHALAEAISFSSYLPYFDIVLDSHDFKQNLRKFVDQI